MKWVYIFKCYNGFYYVGETKSLYTRFWKHDNGTGGFNTSLNPPKKLLAIYKAPILHNFLEYDRYISNNIMNIYFNRTKNIFDNFSDDEEYDCFQLKNNIVEKLMINNKSNWEKFRGGKYTRTDVIYKFPKNQNSDNYPVCYCGLPCDIKKKDDYLFFRCPKKNMTWIDTDRLKLDIAIDNKCCKYFKKYEKDIDYYKQYKNKKTLITSLVNGSTWLENIVGYQCEFCIGECGKRYNENNTIRYNRRSINLCFNCFINKNDILKMKYTKCQIIDSSDDE